MDRSHKKQVAIWALTEAAREANEEGTAQEVVDDILERAERIMVRDLRQDFPDMEMHKLVSIAEDSVVEYATPHGSIEYKHLGDLRKEVDELLGWMEDLSDDTWLCRWAMPGYLDTGPWHVGDTPAEAVKAYFEGRY